MIAWRDPVGSAERCQHHQWLYNFASSGAKLICRNCHAMANYCPLCKGDGCAVAKPGEPSGDPYKCPQCGGSGAKIIQEQPQ